MHHMCRGRPILAPLMLPIRPPSLVCSLWGWTWHMTQQNGSKVGGSFGSRLEKLHPSTSRVQKGTFFSKRLTIATIWMLNCTRLLINMSPILSRVGIQSKDDLSVVWLSSMISWVVSSGRTNTAKELKSSVVSTRFVLLFSSSTTFVDVTVKAAPSSKRRRKWCAGRLNVNSRTPSHRTCCHQPFQVAHRWYRLIQSYGRVFLW